MTVALSLFDERSRSGEPSAVHATQARSPGAGEAHIDIRRAPAHVSAAADWSHGSAAGTIFFGPFCLLPAQRILREADEPVRLGSRALDILIALVERRGELVSKRELMAIVWPDTVVVDANLTVHVAALRRALGDGQSGNRYILNIPGRGYRFVAPVTRIDELRF